MNLPPNQQEADEQILKKIGSGRKRVSAGTHVDPKDVKEIINVELERAKLEFQNENLLIGLREKYGKTILDFLWAYFTITILFISLTALKAIELNPIILTSMIGGTAVSVIGVVGTVAAGLFRTQRK